MDYSSERNYGCRINEYYHRGLKFLSLENELLKLSIIVDKGTDIFELIYKPLDLDFMWKAPGGIRETSKFIPTTANSLGNNIDYYEGGWHEALPGGGPFNYRGAEIGLHGEVALIPWNFYIEEDNAKHISVVLTCRTYKFPFFVKKRISLDSASMLVGIEESLTNESNQEIEFMWGQHPTYGKPFLDGKCRIDIKADEFIKEPDFNPDTSYLDKEYEGKWPIGRTKDGLDIDFSLVPPGRDSTADIFYLKKIQEGWYAVTNQDLKIGIGLYWDLKLFPYIWYWMVFNGVKDYPWWGNTYNIGLEPWSSIPMNFESARKNGKVLKIKGNEIISTFFKVVIYKGLEKVGKITEEGEVT